MGLFGGKNDFYKRLVKNKRRAKNEVIKDFLEGPWPDAKMPAIDVPYTAIDIETSGLNPKKHEILSVGMVNIDNGTIDMKTHYYQLVSPKAKKLDDENVTIHHLTEEELARERPIEEQFEDIAKRLKGRIAIVHYSAIETRFLNEAAMNSLGEGFEFPFVDTLSIELRRYPNQLGAEPYRLPTCCARYGLPRGVMHNAFTDALATAQLYLAQLAYAERGAHAALLRQMM